MVDTKAASKHREKVNKLVAERLGTSPGKDEIQVRREVNKELREQRKKRKRGENQQEIDKIKENIAAQLGDSDPKKLQKAIAQATSKYYSTLKKSKSQSIKQKCDKILEQHVSEKWHPSKCNWYDKKCQKRFEELQFLGAMMDINILKNPEPMEKIFPEECKTYFDFLAMKRFKREKEAPSGKQEDGGEDVKEAEIQTGVKQKKRKLKSAIAKKVQEILTSSDGSKDKMKVLKEVVADFKEDQNKKLLKQLRQQWRPTKKEWFDKECKAAYKRITDMGAEKGLSMGEVASDYKKFKTMFKSEAKAYFNLLAEKKKAFDIADKEKAMATEN